MESESKCNTKGFLNFVLTASIKDITIWILQLREGMMNLREVKRKKRMLNLKNCTVMKTPKIYHHLRNNKILWLNQKQLKKNKNKMGKCRYKTIGRPRGKEKVKTINNNKKISNKTNKKHINPKIHKLLRICMLKNKKKLKKWQIWMPIKLNTTSWIWEPRYWLSCSLSLWSQCLCGWFCT